MTDSILAQLATEGIQMLAEEDFTLYELLLKEYRQQTQKLSMLAASGMADPSVLACKGSTMSNVTTEGYPGKRYHGGCEFADQIEQLAIDRAKVAFKARYANVQPHSGTSANEIVLFSILKPGDTLLGMELNCGGHLTHGSPVSISGSCFQAIGYGLDAESRIDYSEVSRLAKKYRPKLIVAGASSYPRTIDFKRFRDIADQVGGYLLADISHIAGLVAAGEHPSPIDDAHFTTTSTYKQLGGPRGGLILMGKDFDRPSRVPKYSLSEAIQRTVFPYFQGTPDLSGIAAKARALASVATEEFKLRARAIVQNARILAAYLVQQDHRVITGGSDNHMVLLDVSARGLTGRIAETVLDECRIIVNKNRIPGDRKNAMITSGLRLGTNGLAIRGMPLTEVPRCAALISKVLSSVKAVDDRRYRLSAAVRRAVQNEVGDLCVEYPIPGYPIEAPVPVPSLISTLS